MRLLPLFVLALIALPNPADAKLIGGIFGGEINHDLGGHNQDLGTFDGFGLGIESGDRVHGSFGYESDTGDGLYFMAQVQDTFFKAGNLRVEASTDFHITYFYIMGQLESGLFMSVGLTSGDPVLSEFPPLSLSSDDWYVGAFKISATTSPPIEVGTSEIESIRASYLLQETSSKFFLRATEAMRVSEPHAILLFGLGLVSAPSLL